MTLFLTFIVQGKYSPLQIIFPLNPEIIIQFELAKQTDIKYFFQ